MPDLPVANLTLTINQFRALGGVFPISADIALTTDYPDVFIMGGDNLIIKTLSSVKLVFTLNEPDFLLLGIIFRANAKNKSLKHLNVFQEVVVTRGTGNSEMTVTDQNEVASRHTHYDYVILVQNLTTGEVGIIDPGIRNEP